MMGEEASASLDDEVLSSRKPLLREVLGQGRNAELGPMLFSLIRVGR